MIAIAPGQPGNGSTTLLECYENTYARQKLRGAAASTRKHYFYSLRYFDQHLGRPATIADLTDDTVGAAMGFIVADDGLALGPRSANKFRDNILALWRFLARKQIVGHWPDVDELIEPKRIPVAWTPKELAKLWRACDSSLGMIGDVPANLWWHTLHSIAWDSAERITALVNILATDVDLERGWLTVRAELRKGKREDKVTHMHPDTVALLRKIIYPDRERVFPWPYSSSYLWNRYTRLLKLAGLPHDRAHKFHCLRKSVASYFKAAGGDATWLLGHSSAAVTAKYLDPTIVGEQHASDVLFRPMEGSEPADGASVERSSDSLAVLNRPSQVAYEAAKPPETGKQFEEDVKLIEALGEFQESGSWYGRNAVHRRKRAVYRLRQILDACNMPTVADLAAYKIEGYLRSLVASAAARKTVCEYCQDISMFVRWLVSTKLRFGVRPELGRIVGIDARKLIEEQTAADGAGPGQARPKIKLRGSGPPKRNRRKKRAGPFKLGLWTQGGDA